MKSPIKVIKRMVEDYPNDFELGGKVRHYVRWLYEMKQTNGVVRFDDQLYEKNVRSLLADPVVARIAEKLGRNPGQVLIRWAVQRGTSTLPKSVSEKRIISNIDVLSWELPAEDFAALSRLEYQQRMVNPPEWVTPQGPYRSYEELWDELPPATQA